MRYAVGVLLLTTAVAVLCGQALAQRPLTRRVVDVRDVTGDGQADTLSLEAAGVRWDSLDFVLRIRSKGREVFRDAWNNHEEFSDYGEGKRPAQDSLKSTVLNGMRHFFDASNFGPASELKFEPDWRMSASADCSGDPRDCIAFYLRFERATLERVRRGLPPTPAPGREYAAFLGRVDRSPFDTLAVRRIGRELERSKALTFTFNYGYETTRTVVWSAVAQRFVPVFECC